MWQKLLGRQYGFYDLFNRHAHTTMEGAKCLLAMCDEFPEIKDRVNQMEELEHEDDTITHMTVDLLHRSFITPLDRDEVLKLISRMDDVMDAMERGTQAMYLYEVKSLPDKLKQMIKVLYRSQELVIEALKLIPGFKGGDRMRDILKEIHSLENQGDSFLHAGLAELFRDNADNPLLVIKMKDIYETIEKAIDKCEDVADIVESIILEHF